MKNNLLLSMVSLFLFTSTYAQHPVVSTFAPDTGADGTVVIDIIGFDSEQPFYILITEAFGKASFTKRVVTGERTIDVSQLSSGVHLLRTRQGSRQVVERFIKL